MKGQLDLDGSLPFTDYQTDEDTDTMSTPTVPTTEAITCAAAAANQYGYQDQSPTERLEAAQAVLEAHGVLCFGVEYVSVPEGSHEGVECAYANRGDAYDATILIVDNGVAVVGCWGDWFHETEEQYEDRLKLYPSKGPARFAVEFRSGTLSLLDLKVGDALPLPVESLLAKTR